MKFDFKREFGISDLIALAALVVSVWALVQASKSDDPYLVVGGGPVMAGVLVNSNGSTCEFVAQIPLEVDNSGSRSIVLEQLLQDGNLPPVLFSAENKFLDRGEIPYDIYLTQFEMRSASDWAAAKNGAMKLNLAEARHISTLIKSGQSFRRWLVVKSSVSGPASVVPDTLYLAVMLKFSNGESHDVRSALQLPMPGEHCAGGS